MNPFSFFSNLLHGTENFVGGLARGAGQAVNNVVHPQPQRPQPQPQRQSPPPPKPQPQINLAAFTHVLQQIPNVHLQGIEQLTGNHNITLGNVVNNAPVIGPLARGVENAYQQGATGHIPSVGQFTKQVVQTGANSGLQLAGYVAPEAKILKGAGVAARFVNQAVPSAGLSVAGDLAGGNHNIKQIATDAALNGVGAGAMNAAPTILKALKGRSDAAVQSLAAANAKLGQAGHINFNTPLERNAAIAETKSTLNDLQNTLAMHRQAIDEAKQVINSHPTLSNVQKQAALKEAYSRNTKAVNATQQEMAGWLDHLNKLEPNTPHGGMTSAPPQGVAPGTAPMYQQAAQDEATRLANRPMIQKVMGNVKQVLGDQTGAINLGADVAPKEPKLVPNKFTQGARTSPELSPETQSIVDGTHTVKSNQTLVAGQGDLLKGGLEKATNSVDQAMSKAPGKISDQDVANAIAVAKAHDAKGNYEDAARILNDLSDHLVHSGRAVQAASLLDRLSPQGRLYGAQKALKKAGVELTPEIQSGIKTIVDKMKSLPEGSAERLYAGQELAHYVQSKVPSGKVDKLVGIWKAGLLTGARTQTGNIVSNAGNIAIKKAGDAVAAPIDKAFSVFTGQRTKTFTLKGLGSGAVEGTKAAKKFLKTGIDERNLENLKYDSKQLNYKNPVLNAYVNGVFKVMGAADRPAYYAAQKNALYDLAKADGLNNGLKGKALSAHVNNLVKNPTDAMAQSAVDTAEKAVFANDTLLSKAAAGVRNGVGKSPAGNAAVNIIMPFTKVPSSVITQVFDYTPTGAVKEIISQASKGKFDQRALSEALGKATVGTTGVITTGLALANGGILTGAYPKDPKEQAMWKAEGKQPNAILIGGKWRSLNYLAPYGPLLGMGQNISQAIKDGQGALGGVASAVGSGVQTALGQSFLQGVQGVLDAVNDPSRYGLSTAKNMGSSVIPTLVGDVAKAFDPLQRQSNSIGEAIAAKIPGLRQSLLPQQDTLGNQITNQNGPATTMLDPTRPTTNMTNPTFKELDRLMATKNGVFPVSDKTIGSGKDATKLTPEQVNQRQQLVGSLVQPLWGQIIQDPKYATLDDAHKKDALQNALTDAQSAADRQILSQVDPSKLTKPASAQLVKVMSGSITANDYLTKSIAKQTGSNKTSGNDPAATYQAHLAAYQSAKKAGTLSGPADFKAQQSLAKEAITSKYSQDVLDFYGLSKTAMNDYFKQDPTNAKKLYDQAKQLDSELAGNKFKNGLAISKGGAKGKGSRGGKVAKTRPASIHFAKLGSIKTPKLKLAKASKSKGFKLAGLKSTKKINATA